MEKHHLTLEELNNKCTNKYKNTATIGSTALVPLLLAGELVWVVLTVMKEKDMLNIIATLCAVAILSASILPFFIRRVRESRDMLSGRFFLERRSLVRREVRSVGKRHKYYLLFGTGTAVDREMLVTEEEYRVPGQKDYYLVLPECARRMRTPHPVFFYLAEAYELSDDLRAKLADLDGLHA